MCISFHALLSDDLSNHSAITYHTLPMSHLCHIHVLSHQQGDYPAVLKHLTNTTLEGPLSEVISIQITVPSGNQQETDGTLKLG
jgi:hypothetical protein